MKYFFKPLWCWISGHDWTSAAAQGVRPTELQQMAGVAGFKDYATMYCKHCGKVSKFHL